MKLLIYLYFRHDNYEDIFYNYLCKFHRVSRKDVYIGCFLDDYGTSKKLVGTVASNIHEIRPKEVRKILNGLKM